MELLRNNKDKRARKLAKKRVSTLISLVLIYSWEHSSEQRRRLRSFRRLLQRLDGQVIRSKLSGDGENFATDRSCRISIFPAIKSWVLIPYHYRYLWPFSPRSSITFPSAIPATLVAMWEYFWNVELLALKM
jgi:hypothetical protein